MQVLLPWVNDKTEEQTSMNLFSGRYERGYWFRCIKLFLSGTFIKSFPPPLGKVLIMCIVIKEVFSPYVTPWLIGEDKWKDEV